MMNIKEAQNKVNEYITKNVDGIIATIEVSIIESAEQGKTRIDYSFERNTNQNMEIQKRVMQVLANAGYRLRTMNNGALEICWAV